MNSAAQEGRVVRTQFGPACRISRFKPAGHAEEVHLFIEPGEDGSFEEQLEQIVSVYHQALDRLGLARHTAVFRRCFVSDAANQLEAVMASPLGPGTSAAEAAAVSCIEQPPLCFRKLALMAYHVSDVQPEDKTLVPMTGAGPHARTLVLEREQRAMLWTAQMTSEPQDARALHCTDQTTKLFTVYSDFLRSQGANLLGQSVRTWVFVHDVDRYYMDMVDARREYFVKEGLTPETHYIVSTGIEGRTAEPGSLVTLDAVAERGLAEGQLVFIDRLDHLNRTDEYGVTFERAARLDHAERSHVWLSGTASIDSAGRVLHEGDVLGQVERTIENVSVLLAEGRASLDDVAAMIVYLRDGADAERVTALLDRLSPTLPFITVRAPVCRPTWLVEIEAVAIVPNDDSRWPRF